MKCVIILPAGTSLVSAKKMAPGTEIRWTYNGKVRKLKLTDSGATRR